MKKSKLNKLCKSEIKEKLDDIADMSNEEFKINYEYITKTAKDAYNLIRQMEITISKLNSRKKKNRDFKANEDLLKVDGGGKV